MEISLRAACGPRSDHLEVMLFDHENQIQSNLNLVIKKRTRGRGRSPEILSQLRILMVIFVYSYPKSIRNGYLHEEKNN